MALRDEFKAFIMRGNVIDLAVGMVVGTAFSGIVKSLVDDVIITLKAGADAPANGYATLAAAQAAGAVTLNIGLFINTVISFLIIATAIFAVIKSISKLQKTAPEEAPAEPSEEILLLREIRDSLKK